MLLQNRWAPNLIFPLLIGCGLGLLLTAVARLAQVGHRATIWSGAVLAVAIAVAGQHYFSYLDFKAALESKAAALAAKSPGIPLARSKR